MNWGPTTVRTVDLGYEQMLLLEGRPRTTVKVVYGGIWLTEEGQSQDVFASSGDEVALKSRGLAVIEGLGYARVQLTEPPYTAFVRAAWQLVKGFVSSLRHGRARAPATVPQLSSGGCRS